MTYDNSLSRDQFFTCHSKVVFGSHHAADKSAQDLRRKSKAKLRPYKCPYCNKYHLTKDN